MRKRSEKQKPKFKKEAAEFLRRAGALAKKRIERFREKGNIRELQRRSFWNLAKETLIRKVPLSHDRTRT